MKKVLAISLFLAVLPLSLFGQVRGISASKIGAYNARPLPEATVEFEPQIATGWSDMMWNGAGQRVNRFPLTDSVERFTSVDFRVTYGIVDGLEAGIFATGDYELLSFGIKKRILESRTASLAFITGYNYAAGNGIISIQKRGLESHSSLPMGLAGSFRIGEKAGIDADFQVEPPFPVGNDMNKTAHYYFDVDAGYYPVKTLQLVTGFALTYGTRDFSGPRGYQLIINPGVTVETGRHFIIVLAAPFCVAGKTHYCFRSLQMALTLAFD
ncbi:MAG TPA: hypothetical protein VE870_01805 [Bacteroidales bacterium]|nr:hypothetical protein [Bacteroidales bacterium]